MIDAAPDPCSISDTELRNDEPAPIPERQMMNLEAYVNDLGLLGPANCAQK